MRYLIVALALMMSVGCASERGPDQRPMIVDVYTAQGYEYLGLTSNGMHYRFRKQLPPPGNGQPPSWEYLTVQFWPPYASSRSLTSQPPQ